MTETEAVVAKGDPSGMDANNLAYTYAERGEKLDHALELAMQAVNHIPRRAEPMDTLGLVLYKMRQYSAASQAFERALELKADATSRRQIKLHLADAYEASGLVEKANELRATVKKSRG
jgi:uncharacterized protein HemY